jgi:hypothetical protein
MIRMIDGPAKDRSFMARSAPQLLRVVRSKAGNWDTLDQLGDVPAKDEQIFVYERCGDLRAVHIRAMGGSAWYPAANYRFREVQDTEPFRSNTAWHDYCRAPKAKKIIVTKTQPDTEVAMK